MKILLKIAIFVFFCQICNAKNSEWRNLSDNFDAGKIRIIDVYNEKNSLIGIHFKLKKDWKIYAKDSNSFGEPPSINFKNGKIKHKILWPKAILEEEKIGENILKYSIYKNEIILPIEILSQEKNRLDFVINYSLCNEVCIPQKLDFSIVLDEKLDKKNLQLINKFLPENYNISSENSPENSSQKSNNFLIYAIISAFIGGLILNIMPCVLPVLAIKLMSIIKSQNAEISRVRMAFLATILGIISCFLIISFFAISIAKAGEVFNWGVHFQNQYFIAFLLVVILFFTANILGFFEVHFSGFLTNFLNKKIDKLEKKKNIFIPNFLSGILAVMLATPCSAPFLGYAISFSISQSSLIIFTIFLAIAIGFSFPYFLLIIFPKSTNLIPKSKNLMIKVKKIIAGFLIATMIWLIYILSANIDFIDLVAISIISVLFLLSFKIKKNYLKYLAIFLAIFSIFFVVFKAQNAKNQEKLQDSIWIEFDENKIADFVKADKIVIIDVTANWCLTCKFNKINVLQDKEIVARLKKGDIIAMRADITKQNEYSSNVLKFVNKHNRYAIPFNIVFGKNAKNGILTSEVLSKKQLLEIIEKAG